MARLTIYKDNTTDSTLIPNRFIDEYMTDANDAQLKVYLYLIRTLGSDQATSVSDMADRFNHTEKDILRALKYWEDKQLLSLEFDARENLTGILLHDFSTAGKATVSRAAAPAVITSAASAVSGVSSTGITAPATETDAFSAVSAQPADTYHVTKPAYTADQLRSFKEQESTAQLLFIVQSYIGKPLTPSEIRTILFIMDVLQFSEDLIDYLIQYCVDRGKKDFKYIEKVAINWAQQGITTPKQAQSLAGKYDKNVYSIMNQLGKNTSPTAKEMEYITRWTKEYGFTNDVIFEACERTVLATDSHRFEYADSILTSWKKENVRHKSDIKKIDEKYQAKRRSTPKPVGTGTNKFNQFTQNTYDFDALERELLSN